MQTLQKMWPQLVETTVRPSPSISALESKQTGQEMPEEGAASTTSVKDEERAAETPVPDTDCVEDRERAGARAGPVDADTVEVAAFKATPTAEDGLLFCDILVEM